MSEEERRTSSLEVENICNVNDSDTAVIVAVGQSLLHDLLQNFNQSSTSELNDICKQYLMSHAINRDMIYCLLINKDYTECSAASGKHNVHDVRMLNLAYCSEVKVVKESDDPPPALSNLSLQKLNNRLTASKEEKRKRINYIGIGVTDDAQKVFNAIVKTLAESRWEGKNIVVMEEVTIRPPYGIDDCQGKAGNQVLNHVRKIIQKHMSDEAQRDQRKSISPTTVTSLKS